MAYHLLMFTVPRYELVKDHLHNLLQEWGMICPPIVRRAFSSATPLKHTLNVFVRAAG